jgi:hypothetical protein
MNENFDTGEIRAIAEALREYERRCEEILSLLADKRHLLPNERSTVEELYRALKEDLKRAAKHGTLSGNRQPQTRAEQCFYDPALRRAAIDLRPATNSNPISSRWFGAVSEARSELSYWLHNLAALPPGK